MLVCAVCADKMKSVWDKAVDGQTQWSVIRDCMLQTCNEMLGIVGRKQPT